MDNFLFSGSLNSSFLSVTCILVAPSLAPLEFSLFLWFICSTEKKMLLKMFAFVYEKLKFIVFSVSIQTFSFLKHLMGALLYSSKQTNPLDKNMFLSLKRNRLKDIFDCIEVIDDQYAAASYLAYEEFEDVFSSLLGDCEPFFEKLHELTSDKAKVVDIYESLSIFALFCADEFDQKTAFIFKLFDFDSSDTLELSELVLTIQAVIRALCKMASLPLPTISFLENLSKTCFSMIDLDHNKHIEFHEFGKWVRENSDFQDFLLKYSGIQTIENARRHFREFMIHYEAVYDSRMKVNKECIFKDLKEAMENEMKDINPEYLEFLWDVIISSSKEYQEKKKQVNIGFKRSLSHEVTFNDVKITKDVFMEIMKAWAVFSATDINNFNYLSINELKILFWLFEGDEPNEFRLKRELIEMDKDRTETIDRMEWMQHLCVEDSKTGHQIFRSSLKKMFDQYDVDKSGTLTVLEVRNMLKDSFSSYLGKVQNEESRFNMMMMIDQLAFEIMDELNQDADYSLSWDEFKLFMDKCMDKQEKLRKFLETNLI